MLALVILEAVAIGLLALLVAGLLRSHAEILRRLHHLGAGLDIDGGGRIDRPASRPGAVTAVVGETPDGEAVSVALDRPGERTLLLFLSSGCGTCATWWEGLRSGAHVRALGDARVVIVARDATEESPSLLAGLAPPDVTVILASATWEAFAVPGSPYAVLIDGAGATVMGDGVARSWEQLGSLVGQHLGDLRERDGPQVDERLLAAGIHPGHPSLHPAPGSWTREPS